MQCSASTKNMYEKIWKSYEDFCIKATQQKNPFDLQNANEFLCEKGSTFTSSTINRYSIMLENILKRTSINKIHGKIKLSVNFAHLMYCNNIWMF